MKYYKQMFLRWLDFSGKSSRAEYWYAFLYNIIFGLVIELFALPFIFDWQLCYLVAGSLGSLYGVITFIPSLSLTVRRLHDVGHSALYLLITIIPIFGEIMLIYTLAQPSGYRVQMMYENYEVNTDELYNQTYNQNDNNEMKYDDYVEESVEEENKEDLTQDMQQEQEDEIIEVDESQVTISDAPKKSRVEQIKECQQLLEQGVITPEEYNKRVKQILSH